MHTCKQEKKSIYTLKTTSNGIYDRGVSKVHYHAIFRWSMKETFLRSFKLDRYQIPIWFGKQCSILTKVDRVLLNSWLKWKKKKRNFRFPFWKWILATIFGWWSKKLRFWIRRPLFRDIFTVGLNPCSGKLISPNDSTVILKHALWQVTCLFLYPLQHTSKEKGGGGVNLLK